MATDERADSASVMQFPCVIEVKIFLRNDPCADELVRKLLYRHMDPEDVHGITDRQSRKGTFRSYSCKVLARQRKQMDQLYSALTLHPDVLMAL